MSSERLARLVEFGASNDIDSVLVTRHGRIVLEASYAPFRTGLRHRVLLGDQVRHQHPDRHGAGRRPARQHRPQGRGFLRRPHDRQPRRRQEGDDRPAPARHDIGPRLAGGRERRRRILHRHGAQPRLAAVHPRPADDDAAGLALLLQHRQQPPAVGHPGQGHRPQHARLCAGEAVRAARHRRTCCGGSTRRASRSAATTSTCSRATWRRSAISGCAAACGKESRSCRRRGSRACVRPMSTCARAGRPTSATAASSGSCRAATPSWRSATTASSSS